MKLQTKLRVKDKDKAIRATITLYPKDWALARKVAHQSGSRSVSAGIRAMIQFYRLYHPVIEPPAKT